MEVSKKYLRDILDYELETGVFVWKWREDLRIRDNKRLAGTSAGCLMDDGYICIGIKRKYFKAHRLAWLYVHGQWPSMQIDHINGDKSDNRIANLREASMAENKWNSRPASTNKSGVKGVSFDKQSGKWKAGICVRGEKIHLGYFASLDEAASIYRQEAIRRHGVFVNLTA